MTKEMREKAVRRRASRGSHLMSLDRMKKFMGKKAGFKEDDTKFLEVADYEEIRHRFEAETQAVESLVEICRLYRDHLLNFTTTSSKLSDQFRLFYGPDHPRRQLVEKFSEAHRELSESITTHLQDVFNAGIIKAPSDYLRSCEDVQKTMKERDEALRSVERLEKKHESNAVKAAKEEKVMYTGEMLKEAINSYALLHERAVNGATNCHEKIVDVVDPSFMGLLFLQNELYTAAFQQLMSITDNDLNNLLSPAVQSEKNEHSNISDSSSEDQSLHVLQQNRNWGAEEQRTRPATTKGEAEIDRRAEEEDNGSRHGTKASNESKTSNVSLDNDFNECRIGTSLRWQLPLLDKGCSEKSENQEVEGNLLDSLKNAGSRRGLSKESSRRDQGQISPTNNGRSGSVDDQYAKFPVLTEYESNESIVPEPQTPRLENGNDNSWKLEDDSDFSTKLSKSEEMLQSVDFS